MSLLNNIDALIESELKELGRLELGSDDYKFANDGMTKLLHERNEMIKNEQASINEAKKLELEAEKMAVDAANKQAELKEAKKSRITNAALTITSTTMATGTFVWAVLSNFKFEEFCTTSSNIGKNIMNLVSKFFPKH